MDNHEYGMKGSRGKLVIYLMFLVLFTVGLSSCSLLSPRIQEKIIVLRDTTEVHSRDSLYFRDSVYVKEWVKGDTVYVTKFKDRYIYRDRWRDSISVKEVHDTTTVEKKVEKELTWGQKTKIGLFPWLLLGFLGLLVWVFRKPLMSLFGIKI